MALESLILLHDEIADWVAMQSPQPEWGVETRSKGRLYEVCVLVADDPVVAVAARDLGAAHRKALAAWRAWADDSPAGLEFALEASVECARAERGAGVSR